MKLLCEPTNEDTIPFLQKINSGAYRVNPDVLFKGSHSNRMGVCYEYVKTDSQNKEKDNKEKDKVNNNGIQSDK